MTDRIRGLAFVLVAALLLAAPLSFSAPAPVRAEVPVDDPDFASTRAFLDDLGYPVEKITVVGTRAVRDPLRDWAHPTRQPVGISPSSTDIVLSAVVEMSFTPDEVATHFGAGGMVSCDNAAQVVCPTNRIGAAPDTDYYAYVIVTATPFSPVAGSRLELGAAALNSTPPGGGAAIPWEPNPAFPDDIFTGGNQAWVMRSDLGGAWTAFSLAHRTRAPASMTCPRMSSSGTRTAP